MHLLKRIGLDTFMLLLIGAVGLGVLLPAHGAVAAGLKHVTYWAVSLLFFLYGAKLDPGAVRAGLANWRLQGLTFAATYILFPLVGLAFATLADPILGATIAFGLLFLSLLPSTVQSSVAFTAISGGNVPGAICAASVSNMVGVVVTPALVALLMQQGDGGVRMDSVVRIGTQILLPFVIGQVLRPWLWSVVARHKRLTGMVDRGSILLIVYSAFSAGTVSGLWQTVPGSSLLMLVCFVLAFLAVIMGLMHGFGRLFGLSRPDRAVLFYCGSTKSLATGLPIASTLFPADQVGAIVLPIMIYHMVQLLICAVIAQRSARTPSLAPGSSGSDKTSKG
ncbi:bile acid:sodium symporter family protein [Tropicimonas sediminicola]|uniref:Solute carrier family 10 (Sodium/bile acid cotransporter), member 7 n=1 Tax=Tropicimonas sediminicola TaxID=1031541 RepID=A0A239DIF4_9RHOB|nr:bile acid:sodium symporter family protein [Tropicimonas sediminicola]SNS31781.1 solute carrier family 10 (sodium/bile acid cotransporter), member 7 [Tropicimonas sediminicola]